MLKVKLLHPDAKAPTVATPGEDIAYDLYALEDVMLGGGSMKPIRTGVSIEFVPAAGAIIKCRSGLAKMGLSVEGGVIDAGYRGEMVVMLRNHWLNPIVTIKKGDRIGQFLKWPVVVTDEVEVVEELSESSRGGKGFGSSGK